MAGGERDARAKERALLRRDQSIARIRQIHALATSSATDQAVRAQLAIAIVDIDNLWSNFVVENDNLLDILSDLDLYLLGEFSLNVETETRAMVVEAKALSNEVLSAPVMSAGPVLQVTFVASDSTSSAVSTPRMMWYLILVGQWLLQDCQKYHYRTLMVSVGIGQCSGIDSPIW